MAPYITTINKPKWLCNLSRDIIYAPGVAKNCSGVANLCLDQRGCSTGNNVFVLRLDSGSIYVNLVPVKYNTSSAPDSEFLNSRDFDNGLDFE